MNCGMTIARLCIPKIVPPTAASASGVASGLCWSNDRLLLNNGVLSPSSSPCLLFRLIAGVDNVRL